MAEILLKNRFLQAMSLSLPAIGRALPQPRAEFLNRTGRLPSAQKRIKA
jgi:hypothetical protein